MENALRAKPLDIKEQYERQLEELQKSYGQATLKIRAKKIGVPAGRGRPVIETIHQGLDQDGFDVAVSKIRRWFDILRRTAYYKAVKAAPKVQARFADPIRKMILQKLSFGYRTVAGLLGLNKNTLQRLFQILGWQVKKRRICFRPA